MIKWRTLRRGAKGFRSTLNWKETMPRKKTTKLTNYRLWKVLDEITRKNQTTENTIKFAELLKRGYENDLGLLTW